jgi:hypothetical protein
MLMLKFYIKSYVPEGFGDMEVEEEEASQQAHQEQDDQLS